MNALLRVIMVAATVVVINEVSSWYLNQRAEKFVNELFDDEMVRIKNMFVYTQPTMADVVIHLTYINNVASRHLRSNEQRGEYRTRSLAAIQAYVNNWTALG